MKKPKIFIAGSLNLDLVAKTERYPMKGESLIGNDFGMFPGGKGANQAIQAKKIGASVIFFGKVGDDYFGKVLVNNLKKEMIDTKYLIIDKNTKTGCALVIVEKDGSNSIIVVPSANMSIKKDEFKVCEKELLSSDLLLLQLEITFDVIMMIANLAHKNKIFTILNPAPARKIPDKLIRSVDILTPNEVEVRLITDENNIEKAAKKLIKRGAKNVIVTLGEKGCLFVNSERKNYFPTYPVKAVDTTAAGDAFNGALSVAIAKGEDIISSIKFAQAVSALSVTKMGAQTSLPDLKDVKNFIRKHKLNIT